MSGEAGTDDAADIENTGSYALNVSLEFLSG